MKKELLDEKKKSDKFQFHEIESVKALPNYQLYAVFRNGESRFYDVSQLFLEIDSFNAFKTEEGLFEQVYADPHGYAVIWNDKLDLSAEEIYFNGYSNDEGRENGI